MIIYIYYFIFITIIILFEKAIQSFVIKYAYESDLKKILFDQDITEFQNDRYKRVSRILLLLLFYPLLNFDIRYFSLIIILAVYEYKRPYLKLKSNFNRSLSTLRYQFPIWLRQIQILLYSNNVLNSLKLSLDSAPKIISGDLNELIDILEESPNDIDAFTDFMSDFSISEIDRAMKLLYRTYIIDQDDTSKQLNRMIVSTTKWIKDERVNRQKDLLKTYEWIGIIPLFGVTIVFLVIMASLLTNLLGKGV